MRVILTSPTWSLSGVNTFSEVLVRELGRRGHEAQILLTAPHRPESKPLPEPEDLDLVRLDVAKNAGGRARRKALLSWLVSRQPCVYLPNYDFQHSGISAALPSLVGVVGIVHSDDPDHYEHARRLGRYWNRVVAVSDAIADTISTRQPSLSGRLVTIPYGVESGQGPDDARGAGPLQAVYAGRLVHEQKRVLDLVAAVAAAQRQGTRIEVTVIGEGPARADLKEAALRDTATGTFRFVGTVSRDEVRRWYRASDVVLLTSEFEGLPLSILEAMSEGCVPVVRHVRSGLPQLIRSEENGMLVPGGSPEAMASALTRIAGDPAFLARLSKEARRTLQSAAYSVGVMADRYLEVFEGVDSEMRTGSFPRPTGPILPPWVEPGDSMPKVALKTAHRALRRTRLAAWLHRTLPVSGRLSRALMSRAGARRG